MNTRSATIGTTVAIALGLVAGWASVARAGDDDDAAAIEFALTCGARLGAIDGVTVLTRKRDANGGVVQGKYKQRMAVGGRAGILSHAEGGEYSGVFVANFDGSGRLARVSWKLGLFSGNVPANCLGR